MGKKDKKCIGCREDPNCIKLKDASYGYKNGTRDYCKDHKKDDMINLKGYICKSETCTSRAAYGFPKNSKEKDAGKVLYCGKDTCKKPGMINLLNKTCVAGCGKQPTFNYPGEKKGLYCVEDKLPGMVDVKKRTCKKCSTCASYGYKGGEKEYCATHKKDKMVDLTKKKCENGCGTIANWNYHGETSGKYCYVCKKEGMINLAKKICKHPGCPLSASYGTLNDRKQYCTRHKEDNMINFSIKKCKICNKKDPSYGGKDGKKEYCAVCAPSWAKNNKHRMCDCGKIATFNWPGEKRGKYCKEHSFTGMHDVTAIRCDKCHTTATIGIPGNKPSRCKRHREEGMISEPRRRCQNCNKTAIYGRTKQLRCGDHKNTDDYNLIEKRCKGCELLYILNKDGYCGYCDPTMIKNFALVKQRDVKQFLDKNGFNYDIYDSVIDTNCGKERPDFVFDCKTHFVVLEVDENQHKNRDCERIRMINISQSLGLKTIFIRYNPDDYKINNKKQTVSTLKRHKVLKGWLNHLSMKEPIHFLSTIYLFYDNFVEENVRINPIIKMEFAKEDILENILNKINNDKEIHNNTVNDYIFASSNAFNTVFHKYSSGFPK